MADQTPDEIHWVGRWTGRLVLSSVAGTNVDNGFLRNAAGIPVTTLSLTGATWQGGFLRGPATLGVGPLVIEPDVAGTMECGFLRSASGALVTTTGAGTVTEVGFLRDASMRVAMNLNVT